MSGEAKRNLRAQAQRSKTRPKPATRQRRGGGAV